MKSFKDYNPIAVFMYFVFAIVPAMFCINPALMCISLAGAAALRITREGTKSLKTILPLLIFPLAAMIANPLFTHKGATTLFILNNNPITYESAMFGLTAGVMITATLIWFTSFSKMMTTDKLLYVFGRISPKIALILSMALRYIPLYGLQIRKVRHAQKVMGLYKEDNAIDKIRGGLRIFSVMVSWALENGIITADSMTARGYGTCKRTRFSIFRWFKEDRMLLCASLVLTAVFICVMAFSGLDYIWYPTIAAPSMGAAAIAAYICYAILAFLPTYLQLKEEARWRSLQQET